MTIALSPVWLQFPMEVFCHSKKKAASVREGLQLIQSGRKVRDALKLETTCDMVNFNDFVALIFFYRIPGVTIVPKHNVSESQIVIQALEGQGKHEVNQQNNTLAMITKQLRSGLNIKNPPHALDVKNITIDGFRLVSIRAHSNSRIAGWYDTKTRTIHFCYYFRDHNKWNYFLNNLERYTRRQERYLEAVG